MALMPAAALAAALPGSLAILLAWKGPRGSPGAGEVGPREARALAWTCLLSLGILAALGVHNVRYAMPSMSFVPVLVGHAWRRAMGVPGPRWREGELVALQRGLRVRGQLSVAGLMVGAAVWIGVLEPRERARSGREAGVSLGAALPDGAMVWADQMIEARPEVLWYARREAGRRGCTVSPAWIVGMARAGSEALPRRGYLLLRADPQENEEEAYRRAGLMDRLTKVWEGRIHKFSCVLYRKD